MMTYYKFLNLQILYVREYVRPSASDKEIMETTKCTEKSLSDVEQLIEFIKQEKGKDNFNKSNVKDIGQMIDGEEITPYGMFVNESGNGELSKITEESRQKLARSLINGD